MQALVCALSVAYRTIFGKLLKAVGLVVRAAPCRWALVLAITASWLATPARGITIDLNYDYDTNGFFDDNPDGSKSASKLALEFAARAFEPFMDNLLAIQPGGANSWTAQFRNPDTGQSTNLSNLVIPAGTVLIFAGARDLGGAGDGLDPNTVGLGGPGAVLSSSGFTEIVESRGQGTTRGVAADDFGPWGGAIAFDTTTPAPEQPRNWYFDIDTAPSSGQIDFVSVAMHELAHLFGFGISSVDSFKSQIPTGTTTFEGPVVVELAGAGVQLASGNVHWDFGITSPPYADTPPPAALTPSLAIGKRRVITPLDYAGLKDIGWEVPDQLLVLPGDLDGDLDVDGSDLLRWQRGFGLTAGATAADGDANGDGGVDAYDLWVIDRNFGETGVANIQPVSAQVPEPATAGLLAAALMLLAGSRRCPLRRRLISRSISGISAGKRR